MSSSSGLFTEPILVLEPGRHTATVNRLDADAAGHFLVTASNDKTARVWSAQDGRLLRTLRLPAGPGDIGKAYAAAVSPDGALVAAGGWTAPVGVDESVYLFEAASGRLRHRVGGLPEVVCHLAFSLPGDRLAATLGDAAGVRLIDPASGFVMAADEDYGDASYGAVFDSKGRLATTSYDGKLRLYDPGLRLLRVVQAPSGKRPFGIVVSPDGKRLAVGYEDAASVDVLDTDTLEHQFALDASPRDNGNLAGVAWSVDGSLYAAGTWPSGDDVRLRRWPEGGRGRPVDVTLGRGTVMSLRALPDGRLAFAGGGPRLGLRRPDGGELWSLGSTLADFREQHDVLAVSADGTRIRFGCEQGGRSPVLFSLAERRLVPEGAADLATARVDAAGLRIEGWRNSTTPTLNGQLLELSPHETARSLAITPEGQSFVLGASWSLRLFDAAGRERWQRAVPGIAWAVTTSPDGRLVVAACGDGTIRWHRLEDGAELLALYLDADRERWVLWTPGGSYDASPGGEDLIGWQINRGRDEAPAFHDARHFRERFHRPELIDLALQELDRPKSGLTLC